MTKRYFEENLGRSGAWFPANKVYQACMRAITQNNKNFEERIETEIQKLMEPGWFGSRTREKALKKLKKDIAPGTSEYDIIKIIYDDISKEIGQISELALHVRPTDKIFLTSNDFKYIVNFYKPEASTSEMLKED